MQPIVADVPCLFVNMLDITVSSAKTAEPVEMLFEIWTCVNPKNHALGGGPDHPSIRGSYLVGGSRDAACHYQYCSNLFFRLSSMFCWPH